MDFTPWQKELFLALTEKKLDRDDIFSVMLVLSREEKAREMTDFLKANASLTPDDIRQRAGMIAFGENA